MSGLKRWNIDNTPFGTVPGTQHGIVEKMLGAADAVAARLTDTHVHGRLAQVER